VLQKFVVASETVLLQERRAKLKGGLEILSHRLNPLKVLVTFNVPRHDSQPIRQESRDSRR
jgi:hypothetical protein